MGFLLLAEHSNQLRQNPMLEKVAQVPFVRRHWNLKLYPSTERLPQAPLRSGYRSSGEAPKPSHACKSPSPCAALHFLLVSRPIVQGCWIEVRSVRPNEGADLRVYFDPYKELWISEGTVELTLEDGLEIDFPCHTVLETHSKLVGASDVYGGSTNNTFSGFRSRCTTRRSDLGQRPYSVIKRSGSPRRTLPSRRLFRQARCTAAPCCRLVEAPTTLAPRVFSKLDGTKTVLKQRLRGADTRVVSAAARHAPPQGDVWWHWQ